MADGVQRPTPIVGEPPMDPTAKRFDKARGTQKTTITSMKSRGVVSQPEDRHRTRTTDLPFLNDDDILKVKNVDNVTWEFRWERKRFLIRPGETGLVPFPALVNWLGDPRSVSGEVQRFLDSSGNRGVIMSREDGWSPLFARYSIENFDLEALLEYAPKVEVYTMDDERITFPVENPHMIPWPVDTTPLPGHERSDQRRMMDALAEENRQNRVELAELRQLLNDRMGGDTGVAPPDDDFMDDMGGATVDQGPRTTL